MNTTPQIVDYMVLSSSTLSYPIGEDLVKQVKKAIKDGWVPQGGVSIATEQGHYEYIQAMVKYAH